MKKLNRKGFTLVELLAVIVVLAIIILIAMPAVMSAMDKARRNSLVTEMQEIAKVAQTAYAEDSMSGTGIKDICYSLDYLVDAGYLDKKIDGYSGSVYLKVAGADGTTEGVVSTEISISNSVYSYNGDPKKAEASKLGVEASVPNNCSQFSGATKKKCGTTSPGNSGEKGNGWVCPQTPTPAS